MNSPETLQRLTHPVHTGNRNQPLCDLILLSWNHLEQTQPCLESLFQCTKLPTRLVIVDNGSEPPVREVLRQVRPAGAIKDVTLVQLEQNEGFPRGMNQGIRASRAPYVCLLNNDLRFTTGWLREMIYVAATHPTIGVVNPTSNTFGNRPGRGISLDTYAERRRSLHGRYTEVGMCIGFCMLIKREVMDRIGGLNEEVERIFFEDEDFCMRAQQAGYQSVVAAGSYVFHAEHQTVSKMPEREALFARNRRWCEERWGKRLRLAWPRFEPIVPGSDELRDWLLSLLKWARRRTMVYVYCPIPSGMTGETLFQSVGLVPHADIHWFHIPHRMAPWAAAAWILRRRKKPFNFILAPTAGWARMMAALRRVHRAQLLDLNQAQTVYGQRQPRPLAMNPG